MKIESLKQRLKNFSKVAIALSGGLDSSVLLAFCVKELGAENCLALTASTDYMMESEIKDALELSKKLNVECVVEKFDIPDSIKDNPKLRCYLCKTEVFSRLLKIAKNKGFMVVCDGTNADDISDYRPGMKALRQLGVESPFLDCGIGKSTIRNLAKEYGMPVASKPAFACLLTRLEHDKPIDITILKSIDKAETFIRNLGFENVRVRVHSKIARIELDVFSIPKFCDPQNLSRVDSRLKELGFENACLDLGGYKRGNMNKI